MDAPAPLEHHAQVEAFSRRHRTGLVTILFTDIVGSTALKERLGDQTGAGLIEQHHALVRQVLKEFVAAEEISTAGDSFLILFTKPSDAAVFALGLLVRLRAFNQGRAVALQDRVGIHLGEVVIAEAEGATKAKDVHGVQVDVCARVMSLAQAGQILLSRAVFDNARQSLKGEEIEGVGALVWLNHGMFGLKGVEAPVEICEVRAAEAGALSPPTSSEKAQRLTGEGEPVLGWRPAVGQAVPNTKWVLEEKLGEGGFGEVWVGRHQTLKADQRVFKFCFRADRVRSLKREVTLFRLLKERVGEHPKIVRLYEVHFDQPPFYLEEEYVAGKDLKTWCEAQGGVEKVPLETRLEVVAQVAEALQAAHDAGIIHRDVKPGNILISGEWQMTSGEKRGEPREVISPPLSLVTHHSSLSVKLTDFGIGQVISAEYFKGITRAGFTQTMLSSSSSQTGTQLYMAPELLVGTPATTRSDIYSLGVVLYQLLIGDFKRPVTADWPKQVTDPLLREDLEHCFAWNPEERFAGAAELARQLRRLPERRAEQEHRRRLESRLTLLRRLAILVGGILLLAVAGFLYQKNQTRKVERLAEENRRNLYVSDMYLAHRALQDNNLGRARSLLEAHRPGSGQKDLRGFEWRYLWNQSRGDEIFTYTGHSNIVTCAVFSPNGRWLASTRFDGRVHILDLTSRQVVHTLEGFSGLICQNAVAFSPDGRLLAATGDRRTLVWEVPSWKPVRVLEGPSLAVAFHPTQSELAVDTSDAVNLWDTDRWELRRRFEHPLVDAQVAGPGLAFSPDGMVLCALARDAIYTWNPNSASAEPFFTNMVRRVFSVACSSRMLAVGDWFGRVQVWDLRTWRQLTDFQAHPMFTMGLAFAPSGEILATGGGDQLVHLWDVNRWAKIASLQGHQHEVWSVRYSPDGRWLATTGKDETVRLWQTDAPPRSQGLADAWLPLWFSRDGRMLLTVNSDRTIHRWEVASRKDLGAVALAEYAPGGRASTRVVDSCWRVSGDGNRLVIGDTNGLVRIWELEGGSLIQRIRVVGPLYDAWFSPSARLLATATENTLSNTFEVWDLTAGRRVTAFGVDAGFPNAAAFSPDERKVLFDERSHAVQVRDLKSGELLATLPGHHWAIHGLAFTPDGRTLLSASADNTVRFWDVHTWPWHYTGQLRGDMGGLFGLSISPDGRVIATWSFDETMRLWHFATRKELLAFKTSGWAMLFSPDGRYFALGGGDPERSTGGTQLWYAPPLSEIDAR